MPSVINNKKAYVWWLLSPKTVAQEMQTTVPPETKDMGILLHLELFPSIRKKKDSSHPPQIRIQSRNRTFLTCIIQLRFNPVAQPVVQRKCLGLCKIPSPRIDKLKKHRADATLTCSPMLYSYLKGLPTWIMHTSYFYIKHTPNYTMNSSMMAQISRSWVYKTNFYFVVFMAKFIRLYYLLK